MDNERTINPRLFLAKAMMTGSFDDGHCIDGEQRIGIAKFLVEQDGRERAEQQQREAMEKHLAAMNQRPFPGI